MLMHCYYYFPVVIVHQLIVCAFSANNIRMHDEVKSHSFCTVSDS